MKSRHYLDDNVEDDHRRLVASRDDLNGTEVSRHSTISFANKN